MGIELKDVVIGLLLFSFVVTSFGVALTDFSGSYDVGVNDTFYNTYNNLQSQKNLSQNIFNSTRGADVEETDYYVSGFTDAFRAMKLIFGSMTTINRISQDIREEAGIPWIVWILFIAIIMTVVAFAVIAAILKFRL